MKLFLFLIIAGICWAQKINYVNQVQNKPVIDSREFNWTRTSGSGVSGSLNSTGGNILTFNPCPLGVNGTNPDQYIYISGGAGTAEVIKINGGTCTSGANNGTLAFTTANSHSGSWKIGSATIGLREALWSCTTSCTIQIPAGSYTMYAPWKRRVNIQTWIEGVGESATTINISPTFSLTAPGIFDFSPGDVAAISPGGLRNFNITFTQPDSTDPAAMTHYPPVFHTSGGTTLAMVENITVSNAWDVIKMSNANGGGTNGARFTNIKASYYHRFFDLDMSFDSVRIENAQGWQYGLLGNQVTAFLAADSVGIYAGRVDDLKVINSAFYGSCADLHLGADGNASTASFFGVWCDSGGYTQSNGVVRMANSSFSVSGAKRAIYHTGGQLIASGIYVGYTGTLEAILSETKTAFSNAPTIYKPLFMLSNSYINTTDKNIIGVLCTAATPWTGIVECMINGNNFVRIPGNYNVPMISVQNGTGDVRLTATGNRISDNTGGSGVFIALGNDNYHTIADDNVSDPTWTHVKPASIIKAVVPERGDIQGANVVAASTITPSGAIFFVTGTTTIDNITAPVNQANSKICIIPAEIWAMSSTGNIAVNVTGQVGRVICLRWLASANKWYPDK